jgi:hypothetical protein
MTGLSAASVQRLTELEGKGELAPVERGELRAMTRSRATAEEHARMNRLLAGAPTSPAAPASSNAYARGLSRGATQGGRAYTEGRY